MTTEPLSIRMPHWEVDPWSKVRALRSEGHRSRPLSGPRGAVRCVVWGTWLQQIVKQQKKTVKLDSSAPSLL